MLLYQALGIAEVGEVYSRARARGQTADVTVLLESGQSVRLLVASASHEDLPATMRTPISPAVSQRYSVSARLSSSSSISLMSERNVRNTLRCACRTFASS